MGVSAPLLYTMRKPDDEFIKRFRERFGDLLLSCQGERGLRGVQSDVGDAMPPTSYVIENEPIDVAPTDDANPGQKLWRESGYPKNHSFHAPISLFPMVNEAFHDGNLSRPGADFYNNVGDIRSPLVQWNTNISPILDNPIQSLPQCFWNGPGCFTPLAESQGCLYDNSHSGQADGRSTLIYHDFEYATLGRVHQDIFTCCCSEQSDPKSDLATPEARVNENWPYSHREKYVQVQCTLRLLVANVLHRFRYNATLQAPTAVHQNGNEKPITYLNEGQTYSLTVADSSPSTNKAGTFEYRTTVHVSFEGEDQRSDPVASWQLWKEIRGLEDAHEREGLLAVEYIDPSQGDVRNQGHCQVQLEEASLNGFCVIWTADRTTNVYEAPILLKFNFVSTDFTRLKGVKGVPVRLCAKTEMLRSGDGNKAMVNEPEMCYSVVKLFRDHGAERKLWNDKVRMEKKVEKLKKRSIQREPNANFARQCHNNSAINGQQVDIPPQKKRKKSITPRASPTSDGDIRAELATTAEALSSARPVSVLGLRGNMKDSLLEDQHSTGAITLASEGAAHLKNANVQVDSHSSHCQDRSPKPLKGSIGTSASSPFPADLSKFGSYHRKANSFFTYLYFAVACFYVLFAQNGKQIQATYYAIYLASRTSLNLKVQLAAKLQIDPCLVIRIIWVNSKGLKVVVDNDVVRQLPEAQIMTGNVHKFLHTGMALSGAKRPEVEVELVF